MRKAYITGMTGTVAPYLKDELQKHGYQVFDKHIRINSDDDLEQLRNYINQIQPDYIFHLALGPFSFATTLAEYCEKNSKTFVYISTVSVFEDNDGGPYNVDTEVKAVSDYGKYKYDCEKEVLKVKEDSFIIRIGWQISDKGDNSSNNMFNFIESNLDENNEITVSDAFYPSTSFLNETVHAIRTTVENKKPGLYLANSNLDKSLFEIISKLKDDFHLNITVKKDSEFARNDIMIDERVDIKKL